MAKACKAFVLLALLCLSIVLVGQSTPRVRVSESVSKAFVVKKVPPAYPQEARDQRVEGTVVMKAEINTEGDVTELTVVSGPALLAPAAVEVAKQWEYRPYVLNGEPLNFKLSQ